MVLSGVVEFEARVGQRIGTPKFARKDCRADEDPVLARSLRTIKPAIITRSPVPTCSRVEMFQMCRRSGEGLV